MRKKKKIQITDRDKEIFHFLFENRMATAKDITNSFFSSKGTKRASRRLKKLKDFGLISIATSEYLYRQYFYFLTDKGLKAIYPQSKSLAGLRLKSPSPFHDYQLTRLRNVLSKSSIIHEYYTENMLQLDTTQWQINNIFKYEGKFRPDALFVTKADGKKFYNAVELELNQKGTSCYKSKIQKYYLNGKISYILFISNCRNIEKKVMEIEKQLYPDKKTRFYYGNFDSLLQKKLPFRFINCHGIEWDFE